MEEKTKEILDKLFSSKTGQESVHFLHDEYFSEWQLLLEKAADQIKSGNTSLLLKIVEIVATKVLNPACEPVAADIGDKVGKILTVTCGNSKFIDSIKTSVIDLSTKQEKHEIFWKLLNELHVFCLEVLKRIPYLGKDLLLNLICTCIGATATKSQSAYQTLLQEFVALQQKTQEINKVFEDERKPRKRYDFDEGHELLLHSMEPPEDFREIPIIPTLDELINEKDPFLRPNKVKGPYRSSEHYLDVQFRLLREDFILPLRRAVQDFMKNKDEFIQSIGKRRTNRELDISVRLYSDVTFHGTERSRNNTTDYLFNLPQRLTSRVNWDKSKRLLPGCLVMLTSDYCKTATFALTVPPKQKKTGSGDPRRQELADGILRLTIETGKEFILENKSYLMFECEAFFEAYRYNLGMLQGLLFLENDGPEPNSLNKFIVKASPHVGLPLYLTCPETRFRLPTDKVILVYPSRPYQWPSEEIQTHMALDPDQYDAVQTALTSELAVIQGPPGTGKTYVGLQIVKTLILNKGLDVLPPSPFLVLCYTNHALDQFLELLLLEMPDLDVVRVGGQSKSEIVSDYTLFQQRIRLQRDWDHPRFVGDVREQKAKEHAAFRTLKEIEEKLARLAVEIQELSCPTGIFNFRFMEIENRLRSILPESVWKHILWDSSWLEIYDDSIFMRDFHIGTIISRFFVVSPKSTKPEVKANFHLGMENNKRDNAGLDGNDKKQEEGEYDMDELMEHRLTESDNYTEKITNAAEERHHRNLYFDNQSIRQCTDTTTRVKTQLQRCYNEYNSSLENDSKKGNTKIDYEKYTKLWDQIGRLRKEQIKYLNMKVFFSTVFGLHKEGRLAFYHVDKVFLKSVDGETYEVSSDDLRKYPARLKWGIYFKIVEIALETAKKYKEELEDELKEAREKYNKESQILDAYIMKSSDIIGMTTTGAAKMHGLLEIAKPEVVIVEEAAEILEAHIVTSLTEDCKHLILIGDHLQLQPSVNIYELETKYRLNVSLFERMIRNGVPYCTLKTQHRMLPAISNLIIGTIYEKLYDHPDVHEYPPVKGLRKSLFFLTHTQIEETDTDLLSKSNRFEADFLLGLCEYLLRQGYTHNQITILTTYNGQMFLLKKLIPESCRGVRITCVDNFQGEENDIILLSLVRSNSENKVGFLGKQNRICVALSRARHGLYVVGNMDGLRSASETWREIEKKLKSGENIGNALELICERHQKVTWAKSQEDFQPLVNGGCDQICNAQLNCGHICNRFCHADDQTHEKFNCMKRCSKTCPSGHPCIAICSRKCPPCLVRLSKILPCSHTQTVGCHVDPKNAMCQVSVLKLLPCEHEVYMKCHQDASKYECTFPTEKILDCGHVRMIECYISPEDYKCEFEEEKVLPCGHIRNMKCYQKVDTVKCDEMVEKVLSCGHTKVLKCYQPGSGASCDIILEIVLPDCSHIIEIPCSSSANPQCTEKCEKILSCGHKCTLNCHIAKDPSHTTYKCKQPCARSCSAGHPCQYPHDCHTKCLPCTVFIEISFDCGHSTEVECSRNNGKYRCTKKIKKILPCEHEQLVSCSVSPDQQKCTYHVTNCQKKCDFGHKCSFEHACNEDCPPCDETFEKKLKCGHEAKIRCHEDEIFYNCTHIGTVQCTKCNSEVITPCWKKVNERFICKQCASKSSTKSDWFGLPKTGRFQTGNVGYQRSNGSRYFK